MSGKFDIWSDQDIWDVIDAYPMASILGFGGDSAILDMPVLLEDEASGQPINLLGHLPRRSLFASGNGVDSRAMFLFRGPSGYISPAMAGRANWAPTWNFITINVVADICTDDTLTDRALRQTVAHMERGQQEPWSVDQLSERYEKLMAAVIGFRARIVSVTARFKLGQDETTDTFDHIISSLTDEKLKYWMLRMR